MPAGLTLTVAGAAEIEAAYQAGSVVTIQTVAIGDGGNQPLPSTADELAAMTALNGEFGREPFSSGTTSDGFISGQVVIDCKTYPGKTLRELGLVSQSGTLIAYGLYPDTYLPAQTDSVIKEVIITSVLELTHAESVTLLLDPERMVLTQDAGDKRYLRISEDLAEIAEKGAEAQARGRMHLDVYSTTEADNQFQPTGNYAMADDVYTKTESDGRFQAKGEYYTKTESDGRFQAKGEYYTKTESDGRFQAKGEYYTKTESDAHYIQNWEYTAEVVYKPANNETSWTFRAPAGCTISGIIVEETGSNSADNISGVYYKAAQIYINGAWRSVSG
ncbi:phage tail-collar fiber domain-containing protein [Escherichia coli]|uniref:phage tail-collar fiber domain-containing protein n=2 Tax=Escherichia coli TaxID=562 RepID=UPI0010DA5687|nr:phage tail protein [Escherichia coli]GDG34658.1 phage tail fiber [Escherichia coli]